MAESEVIAPPIPTNLLTCIPFILSKVDDIVFSIKSDILLNSSSLIGSVVINLSVILRAPTFSLLQNFIPSSFPTINSVEPPPISKTNI